MGQVVGHVGALRMVKGWIPEKIRRKRRVLMLGLRGAGKTTLLYQLQNKEVPSVIQLREINEVTITKGIHKVTFTETDLPTDDSRLYRDGRWAKDVADYQGLIWVVDSQDKANFITSGEYLHAVVQCLGVKRRVPILVLANKSDLDAAADLNDMHGKLGLHDQLYLNRIVIIRTCCAITGKDLKAAIGSLMEYM